MKQTPLPVLDDDIKEALKIYKLALRYFKINTELALDNFLRALPLLEKSPLVLREFGLCSKMISICYSKFGKYSKALAYGQKAVKIFKKLGQEDELLKVYRGLALTCIKMKDFKAASEYNAKVEAIFKLSPAKKHLVKYNHDYSLHLQQCGSLLLDKGDTAAALKTLEYLVSYTRDDDRKHYAKELLADIYRSKRDDHKAFDLYSEVIDYFKEERASPYYKRAELHWHAEKAVEDCRKAINIAEADLKSIKGTSLRRGFVQDKLPLYQCAVKTFLEHGAKEDAFKTIQRIKARVTTEKMLRNAGKLNLLVEEIYELRRKLAVPDLEKSKTSLSKELQELNEKLNNLQREDHHLFELLNFEEHALGIKEVQKLLEKDTACIDIFVFEKEIVIYFITPITYMHKRLDYTEKELEERIGYIIGLVHTEGEYAGELLEFYLNSFYREMFADFLEQNKNISKFLLVPHGEFHNLSFCPVLDMADISYLPSISSLEHFTRSKNDNDFRKCCVFADALGDLADSRKEASYLTGIYPKSELYLEKAATKANFLEKAGKCDILHIACHTFFDENVPENSGIGLLGPDGLETRVTGAEILKMDFSRVKLVVLSSCHSGISRINLGDENVSLPRAFLIAGAKGAVVTFGEVDDEATTKLMCEMYRHIHSGKTISRSLALAQKHVKTVYHKPYYWAGFQYIGT